MIAMIAIFQNLNIDHTAVNVAEERVGSRFIELNCGN